MSDTPEPSIKLPPPLPQPVRPTRKQGWWKFKLMVAGAVIGGMAVAAAIFGPGPLDETKNVVVPHGSSVREIAELLKSNDAVYDVLLFRAVTKFAVANTLKAGEYQIDAHQSLIGILRMMHEGRSVVRLFTVAEGLTSNEVMRLLNAAPTLGGDTITQPAEGTLLPESYRYIFGDNRAGLVTRMQKSMQDTLNDVWAKRDPNLPITTLQQAVVMASIVEKETGKASERPRIAGVFYNRLRQHMRLQSDPTVIYAQMLARGVMDHNIDHADLSFVSPYNTYTSDGLPPGPICNPGRAALDAALHPETNAFLYFVADGTGGHAFASNLEEHNRNVAKWNLLRK